MCFLDWIVGSAEETRLDTIKKYTHDMFKIARFFIRDLLNAERMENYFICRNNKFFNVILCGTVVSLFSKGENYWIEGKN